MKKWRKSTWALLIWCALILVWAVAGGSAAAEDCKNNADGGGFLSKQDISDACEAGAGLGVAVILFIGFVGFCFFSLIWFMTRSSRRDCPACGHGVKKGRTTCGSCGFDFAHAAASSAAATA